MYNLLKNKVRKLFESPILFNLILLLVIYFFYLLFLFKLLPLNVLEKTSRLSIIIFSIIYIGVLFFIFVLLFYLIFIIFKKNLFSYTVKNLKNYLKKQRSDLLFILFLIFIQSLFVFLIYQQTVTGRFVISEVFFKDFTKKEFLDDFLNDSRTYVSIFYYLLNFIFSLNLYFISIFSRIFSILFVVLFYLLARLFFDKIFSFILSLFLILSIHYQYSSVSIEPIVASIFFTYLSIYLLIKSKYKKNKDFFLWLSIISLFLAISCRYELAIFYGFSFLLSYIFLYKTLNKKVIIFLLFLILFFSVPPLKMFIIAKGDPFFRGSYNGSFIEEIFFRIYNSLIINKQLDFKKGFVSVSLFISFFGVLSYFIKFINFKKKRRSEDHLKILPIVLYFLIYFFSVLFFHVGGLSEPSKYNLNFYPAEIILMGNLFNIFFSRKELKVIVLILMLLFSLIISEGFYILNLSSFNIVLFNSNFRYFEYKQLRSKIQKLNDSCYIIKHNVRYPYLDFYYFAMKNDLFLSMNKDFYKILESLDVKGKCYYYFDGYYSDEELNHENIVQFDKNKIIDILSSKGCKSRELFNEILFSKNISLILFECY